MPLRPLRTAPGRVARKLRWTLFPGSRPAPVGQDNQANREAWLQRTLATIPAGARILDAGPGEQQYRRFCTHLTYVSQDFGQYEGGAGPGLQVPSWNNTSLDIVCDITNIPEPDASFDAIMCIEVLEHVPDPVAALRELSRLLKPGGTIILTAPFCALTHLAPYFFATGLSRYWYEHWLPALGIDIVELEANGNYFSYLAQEVQRVESVAERYTPRITLRNADAGGVANLVGLLSRLSAADKASSELLCYGLHVRGEKRQDV